ncbi:hypothetical protein [Roseomonas xinghualingensis]|uniref:hypothetical protein n=1 Tax=Roseomonas xinghualingensis TaxID=2986475 RepID=UPI0021F0BD40|nr:hypothetical protein [Roseomonas sp. SXEYE001]MCV4210409.1 hypothetical protein [Roseomonas sp. SXEYE001]
MTLMLVLETTNNPGNALTIPLSGAPTGYRPWLAATGAGMREEYVMRDSAGLYEWGVGYVTPGSPNVFTRETVLGGSSGPGVRVAFSGQVDLYSAFIPERLAPTYEEREWGSTYNLAPAGVEIAAARLSPPAGTRNFEATAIVNAAATDSNVSAAYIRADLIAADGVTVMASSRAHYALLASTSLGGTPTAQFSLSWRFGPTNLPAGCSIRFMVYKTGPGAASLSRILTSATYSRL